MTDVSREACLTQIGEQSANLTQLSILADADTTQIESCASDLSRLQTSLKTFDSMTVHNQMGIIKALNSTGLLVRRSRIIQIVEVFKHNWRCLLKNWLQ